MQSPEEESNAQDFGEQGTSPSRGRGTRARKQVELYQMPCQLSAPKMQRMLVPVQCTVCHCSLDCMESASRAVRSGRICGQLLHSNPLGGAAARWASFWATFDTEA